MGTGHASCVNELESRGNELVCRGNEYHNVVGKSEICCGNDLRMLWERVTKLWERVLSFGNEFIIVGMSYQVVEAS